MLIVLCAHFIVAIFAPILFSRLGRSAFYLLAAVPGASFVWLISQYNNVYSDTAPSPTLDIPWVPVLNLNLTSPAGERGSPETELLGCLGDDVEGARVGWCQLADGVDVGECLGPLGGARVVRERRGDLLLELG